MLSWNSLAFSVIQQMLAIWSLVPLPFLNPTWIYGGSRFMYCCSLAWRILSITMLAWEMTAIFQWFKHSLALPLRLEWKLTFSSPVATAEFSKLSWHIEGSTFIASSFRIWNSSTGIPSPPLALFVAMLPKAHLTLHSRMSCSRWSHHHGYLGHKDLFCIVLLCILATSS